MTLRLPSSDLYHTGIVVADLESAKVEFSGLGYEWGFGSDSLGPDQQSDMPVLFPDGPQVVTFKFSYSNDGPHRLELVQAIPGTIWALVPGRAAHHIGYWCDDVVATSALLDDAGYPWTVKVGVGNPDEPPVAVMHQTPSGLHIELVDRTLNETMFGKP